MELEDLKIISKLINKYGIKKFEDIAEINSSFLSYMKNNDTNLYSKFYENDESQIFTNCKSSIFCLKPKAIDFDLLNINTNNPIALPVEEFDIRKYLDNARDLMGNSPSNAYTIISSITESGIVIGFDNSIYGTNRISLEDLKIVKLFLKNFKVYVSKKEPIVHVESENGYAYILGKEYKSKTIF